MLSSLLVKSRQLRANDFRHTQDAISRVLGYQMVTDHMGSAIQISWGLDNKGERRYSYLRI